MRLHSYRTKRRPSGRDASDRATADFIVEVEKERALEIDSKLRSDLNDLLQVNRKQLLDDENDFGFDDLLEGFFEKNDQEFSELFSLIETVSLFLSETDTDDYDHIVNISDHWAKLAALAKVYMPLPRFAQDNRQGSLDRIEESNRRRITGKVVSTSMQKTAVVEVVRRKRDRLTGKTVSFRKKYHVHDENEECEVGDHIIAIEGRPLSKKKRHSLLSKTKA